MGWGAQHIGIALLLDEHGGDKERDHERLADELLAKIRAVTDEYREIVSDVRNSWGADE